MLISGLSDDPRLSNSSSYFVLSPHALWEFPWHKLIIMASNLAIAAHHTRLPVIMNSEWRSKELAHGIFIGNF